MNLHVLCFISVIFHFCTGGEKCIASKSSKQVHTRLESSILCNYDSTIGPLRRDKPVSISINFIPKHFIYNYEENTISIHIWLAMKWDDEGLTWNPKNFDDIKSVLLSSSKIWTPKQSIFENQIDCVVVYKGKVICIPVKTFNVQCSGDLVKFPYDTQTCVIEFDVLPYTTREINVSIYETDIGSYERNPEWKLLNISNMIEQRFTQYSNTTYEFTAYKITIQRHSAYHNMVIMLPAIVMIFMSLLTLMLNYEHEKRFTLGCCNLYIHLLFSICIVWMIPKSGREPPHIVTFAKNSLFICIFTLVITVFNKTQMHKECPDYISVYVSKLLDMKVVHVILLRSYNFEERVNRQKKAIVERNETEECHEDKIILVKTLDILSLTLCTLYYISLSIVFFI